MNKVIFNTWPGAFFHPGGGEVQLLNSKIELEKKNWTVELFDNWNPQKEKSLIYHQFSAEPGTESTLMLYKELGLKIALSPIMWNLYKKEHPRYLITKKMFEFSDVLMTNSKAESERLSAHFEIPLDKFHETRNSVCPSFLNQETSKNFKEKYSIDGDFLLSVANIDVRKNTELLVKACIELKKKLVLIGNIRDQKYYDKVTKLGGDVHFLGPISDKEYIKSALQQCEAYVLPSLCETPGIAALEALSQGAKVIVTEVGATKEYFEDCVTYVDPRNLDSIIKGIRSELLLERKGFDGLKYIKSKFTWDKTADDIIKGYEKIS